MLSGIETQDQRWRPMPKTFDDVVEAESAKEVIKSMSSIREMLGLGVLSGNFTIADSISSNFQGGELIHSAYFKHPDFAGFIAWMLVEKLGFPPSEAYQKLSKTKFEGWYAEIAPSECTFGAAR